MLDSERYKEEFRELNEIVAGLKRRYKELEEAIKQAKADLNAARLEGVMPKTKHLAPKFNKDTKARLYIEELNFEHFITLICILSL